MDYQFNFFYSLKNCIKLSIILGFLLFPNIILANCVEITKIGAFEKDGYEWVEIKNCGNYDINFKKWRFLENIVLDETNNVKSFKAHLIKPYNQEEPILLKDEIGVLVVKPENYLTLYPNFKGKIFDSFFNLSKKGEIIGFKDENDNYLSIVNYPYCKDTFVEKKDGEYICHKPPSQPLQQPLPKSRSLPKLPESEQEVLHKQEKKSLIQPPFSFATTTLPNLLEYLSTSTEYLSDNLNELSSAILKVSKNLEKYIETLSTNQLLNILSNQITILSNQLSIISQKLDENQDEIKGLKNQIKYLTKKSKTKSSTRGISKTYEGIVIMPPYTFNKQYFYINGAQVYSYKSNFPKLEIGDKITIIGEQTKIYGEKRIKIKNSDDIRLISRNLKVFPIEISEFSQNILKENLAKLVKVRGEIFKIGRTYFYIKDKKKNQIKVYSKNLPKNIELIIGNQIQVTGVLSNYKNEFRILPRIDFDIVKENTAEDSKVKGAVYSKKILSKSNIFTGIIYLGIVLMIILYIKLGVVKI